MPTYMLDTNICIHVMKSYPPNLLEKFNALAEQLCISSITLGELREEKPVTADTALRLGKFFKTGAAFWMNIQARFDLETAEDVLAPQIKKIASYEAA
jgi:addiction module HigA family antidote